MLRSWLNLLYSYSGAYLCQVNEAKVLIKSLKVLSDKALGPGGSLGCLYYSYFLSSKANALSGRPCEKTLIVEER